MIIRDRHLKSGFTLLEMLISCVIGMIIMLVVLSFVRLVELGTRDGSQSASEIANARTGLEIIRQDLSNRVFDLPISLGSGKEDQGWVFVNGRYNTWNAGYGSHFPSQKGMGFPNDRIGFFINVPQATADNYEGKSIAHVLYFTAITRNGGREDLTPATDDEELGYSRKLYRLYTPPDRKFERLKLLNPETERGDAALPIGLSHLSATVKSDDADWGIVADSEILSLVATEVAQFSITLGGSISESSGGTRIAPDLSEELLAEDSAESVHALLLSGDESGRQITSSTFKVDLKLCPVSKASSLSVRDWKTKVGEHSLGREGVIPSVFTLKHRLKP